MGGAEFIVFAALVRVVFRRPPLGDNYGLSVPINWRRVAVATGGILGAVVGGWLVYGPGWLPWWASLAVAFAAGAACEWLADWGDNHANS